MVTASHEIKGCLLPGRKVMTNLDSILKEQRIYFANKSPSSQRFFPVVMYGFGVGPWTAISNQSILREISPEYSLKGLMLKLKLQYSGHLM